MTTAAIKARGKYPSAPVVLYLPVIAFSGGRRIEFVLFLLVASGMQSWTYAEAAYPIWGIKTIL